LFLWTEGDPAAQRITKFEKLFSRYFSASIIDRKKDIRLESFLVHDKLKDRM
jgi:hypothetical protein